MTRPQPAEPDRLRDEIDALKAVNRQLYEDIVRLLDLQDAVHALCAADTETVVAAAALTAARFVTGARWARWYEARSGEAGTVLAITAQGGDPATILAGVVPADGIAWQVIRRRRAVWCNEPDTDRRYRPAADDLCGERAACSLTVPVTSGPGDCCALEAAHVLGGDFDDDGRRRLETVAAVAGLRIATLRLAASAPPAAPARTRRRLAATPATAPLWNHGPDGDEPGDGRSRARRRKGQ